MSNSPVLQVFGLGFPWQTADPFLFCVHHEDFFPAGNGELGPERSLLKGRNIGQDFEIRDGWRMYHGDKIPGFPGHPHRGFETVTVVTKGVVDHADSMGAAGRYMGGDTQWMTAGRGVQHSEMFPLMHDDKENTMELFQIWLNLPAKSKMTDPHFTMLWKEDVPEYSHQDEAGRTTRVVITAGSLGDKRAPAPPPESWAADEANEVAIWTIHMAPDAEWELPAASAGLNRVLYYYRGDDLTVDQQALRIEQGALLASDQPVRLRAGSQGCDMLLLQGKPIGEPVAKYGPFVMNTEAEIQQAFADYRKDQFGGWPWPSYDHVHGHQRGRFAKHADGTEEVK
ncbi:pirin family protein [Salinispirillum sp. LH 10-3-1]|uniref:Pirin family protein n=1 Tax=Salinispirillum sp. LH 10-3-1 TaxID=2952525 RepID=A0AB38YES3_9GAMM